MKTKINVFWILIVITLALTLFSSCKDNDWEPLKWTVDNMSPDNIVVKTHPEHEAFESEKIVIANAEGGEIIFYCENYDDLYIAVNEYGNQGNSINHEDLSVNLEGDKMIINFPKLDELPEETSWIILVIKTRSNKNSGTVFWIGRNSDLNYLD